MSAYLSSTLARRRTQSRVSSACSSPPRSDYTTKSHRLLRPSTTPCEFLLVSHCSATAFLKRCLEIDQNKRATSAQLLEDTWLRQPNLSGGIDKVLRDIFLVGSLDQIGI